MRIEAGKCYRTREGKKVGPMVPACGSPVWDTWTTAENECSWNGNGRRYEAACMPETDLVALWADGPVRTVTRKEIMPGYYGYIKVFGAAQDKHAGISVQSCEMDSTKLREAAATLSEIADALDDTP